MSGSGTANQPGKLRPPIALLGVPFDSLTMAEAVTRIEHMIQSHRPQYVVTANMDFLVQARQDVELRKILFDADLVLCDGTPLVWASRLLGNPLPERVAGSDLVPELLALAAQRGYRVFFLGATPEAAQIATEKMIARYPGLIIAGHYSPPFNHLLEMNHDQIQERVRQANPDLLFVSFGCPKQEKWIGMHFRTLGVPVTIGVGATIDFLAGRVRRAPHWMQRSGTEWLFRLLQEPRRLFNRYAKDLGVFSVSFLAQWWRLGRFRTGPLLPWPPAPEDRSRFPARLTYPIIRAHLNQFFATAGYSVLDLRHVERIDSTGTALLMRLQRQADHALHELTWLGPSRPVAQALRTMRLQDFFLFAPDAQSALQVRSHLSRQRARPVRRLAASRSQLAWEGEITALNAPAVWVATRDHFLASPAGQPWILDLANVRFMDSSGLSTVVRAKKLALSFGTDLKLTGVQGPVRNVFRLARLEAFLLNGHRAGEGSVYP
ncbi:MAG TPA: WecB/TagA/CpsF family glycosyltransferase, partial [Clostridia bacterium]|nr:WecB/TagA/CpsF family glycosyltransferase [Clostridia bacterium]